MFIAQKAVLCSAPSKTFLIGEYAALKPAPSVLIHTAPRFTLTVQPNGVPEYMGFSKGSPAHRFLQRYAPDTGHRWIFHDPHQGSGGFGASSAQFLMTYAAYRTLNPQDLTLSDALHEYHASSHPLLPQGYAPSGADVVGQYAGGLCVADTVGATFNLLSWPFEEHDLLLLKTPFKLPTHTHLHSLEHLPFSDLIPLTHESIQALKQGDFRSFQRAITEYQQVLQHAQLTASDTLKWIDAIQHQYPESVVKGCGALGADVILVMQPKQTTPSFIRWLQHTPLKKIASQHSLSPGLQYDMVSPSPE